MGSPQAPLPHMGLRGREVHGGQPRGPPSRQLGPPPKPEPCGRLPETGPSLDPYSPATGRCELWLGTLAVWPCLSGQVVPGS